MHWTKALPWVPFHSPPSSACLQSHPSPLTRSVLWSFFFLFSFSLFSLELTFDTKSVMSFLLSFHFWNSKIEIYQVFIIFFAAHQLLWLLFRFDTATQLGTEKSTAANKTHQNLHSIIWKRLNSGSDLSWFLRRQFKSVLVFPKKVWTCLGFCRENLANVALSATGCTPAIGRAVSQESS